MKLNRLDFFHSANIEPRKINSTNKNDKNINNNINNNKSNIINSYCYLPPIDKSIKKLALQRPTSILNKFITKHAKDIINCTENDMNNVITIQNKYRNEEIKGGLSKSHKNIVLKTEENNIRNKILNINHKKKLDKISLGVLITNINKNEKQNNINNNNKFIKSDSSNISEDNDININDLYDKHKEEIKSRKNSIINSPKRNSKISKDGSIRLSSCFRRMCSYQPDIKLNWKYKYGLKYNLGDPSDFKIENKDIKYQSKIIDNHYKLLLNDINYYHNTIMKNNNYYTSFESLSLSQKIKYNKALEETIGILVLLPKMLLNEFYDLIQNSYKAKIPKMIKFENKYVFDEIENLKDNNKLLVEVIDFFKECYQIFQTVVKEFDKILFKPNEFSKIISCLEKARFNISYINNSSENAFDLYSKDLEIINKLKGFKNKSIKNLAEKLRENYSFRKNEEKQKKIRIYNSLTDREDAHDKIDKYKLINSPLLNIQMKSIINSKMMNDIMRHCIEDSRIKISTERINNEIDGDKRDDDIDKIKSIPPVIKMNLL